MKQNTIYCYILISLCILLLSACSQEKEQRAWLADDLRISPAEAYKLFGHKDTVFIDVRSIHDWNNSTTKIKGAERKIYTEFDTWDDEYKPSQKLVLYCS